MVFDRLKNGRLLDVNIIAVAGLRAVIVRADFGRNDKAVARARKAFAADFGLRALADKIIAQRRRICF